MTNSKLKDLTAVEIRDVCGGNECVCVARDLSPCPTEGPCITLPDIEVGRISNNCTTGLFFDIPCTTLCQSKFPARVNVAYCSSAIKGAFSFAILCLTTAWLLN